MGRQGHFKKYLVAIIEIAERFVIQLVGVRGSLASMVILTLCSPVLLSA